MCSSALGTALGPLLSTVFKRFPSLRAGPLTLDATTMGGWAMVAAWVAFIVAWMALFQEPPLCAPRKNSTLRLGQGLGLGLE